MTDEFEWWDGLSTVQRHELAHIITGKDYTPSERARVVRILMTRLADAAREEANGQAGKRTRNLVQPRSRRPNAMEITARHVGWSEPTARHALYVVDAAEADPKKYGRFQKQMDEDGNVEGAYQALKLAEQDERQRKKKPPLPAQPW
jgi:hypothetical protein